MRKVPQGFPPLCAEMPRKVPVWKLKAKAEGSDLSPKELLYQERQKDANLQHNTAMRQVRFTRNGECMVNINAVFQEQWQEIFICMCACAAFVLR